MIHTPQGRIAEWYCSLSPAKQSLLNTLIAIAGIIALAWGKSHNYF